MILKVCYQNEIHRCSDLPSSLAGFLSLIKTTFRAELPNEFNLSYIATNEAEKVPLVTEGDYQTLLSLEDSKAIKVLIEAKNGDQGKPLEPGSAEYDIISNNNKGKNEEDNIKEFNVEKEKKMDLAGLVEDISQSVIIPQVQKYPYFSHSESEDKKNIRKIVKEVLQEEMPSIISQVKEAVLKELRDSLPMYQPNNDLPKVQFNLDAAKVSNYFGEPNVDEEKKVQPNNNFVRADKQDNIYLIEDEVEKQPPANKEGNIVKKIGTVLKDQFTGLTGKAKDALDGLSHKLDGDPYVVCEEGKYPKSVVEKGTALKEIFADEDKKKLLEFVKQYPRYVTLEQLANLYLVKNQPEGEAQGNQKGDQNNQKDENEIVDN